VRIAHAARSSQGVGDLGRGHKLQRAERDSARRAQKQRCIVLAQGFHTIKFVVIERQWGQCALQLHMANRCASLTTVLIANNTHSIFIGEGSNAIDVVGNMRACGLNTINQYALGCKFFYVLS
jgi:hypothetical protein